MPTTCAEFSELLTSIQSANWKSVGIDGVDGAGKSSLASATSKILGWPTFDVDEYLRKNQGSYIAHIDTDRLRAALGTTPTFIFSGVCLREVTQRLGVSLDGHIYIKRISHGRWADEDECVFPEGLDAALAKYSRDIALVAEFIGDATPHSDTPRLTQEIMRYHDVHRPHEAADIIYERVVDHAA